MRPHVAETTLKWLLFALGGMTCLALLAVMMPTSWMVAGARWSGFGEFPDVLLVQYLTRSVSLLYALIGMMTIYVALDVTRYLALIAFAGWLTVGLGVGLWAVDVAIGMPAAAQWIEGPGTMLIGGAFVWLARRADASRQNS